MRPAIRNQFPLTNTGLRRSGIRPLRLFFVLLLIAVSISSYAAGTPNARPVVVVVANHLSFDSLLSTGPITGHLLMHSSVALANTGVKRFRSPEEPYLAMGSGVRAQTAGRGVSFHEASSRIGHLTAGELYAVQTGRTAPAGSVVCLGLSRILRENYTPPFKAESIGLVGQAFHDAGYRTAVIGNSDTLDSACRLAPLIAMDRRGLIDSGAIESEAVSADPDSPFGYSDDPKKIARLTGSYLADHRLVVIEMGDLNRLEAASGDLSDAAYQAYTAKGMRSLDQTIDRLIPVLQQRDAVLLLCSPVRADSTGYWSNLTPVILYDSRSRPGLLESATTRMPGLISNIDIGPMILASAGLKVPYSATGRAAFPVRSPERLAQIQRLERIYTRNHAVMYFVVGGVGVLTILTATASEIIMRRRGKSGLRRLMRAEFLVAFATPAAAMLTNGLAGTAVMYVLNFMLGVALVLLVSWAFSRVVAFLMHGRQLPLPAVILILTTVLAMGDMLTGEQLMRWGLWGGDRINGIRYYGVGNEGVGFLTAFALTGSLLLVHSLRSDRSRKVSSRRLGSVAALAFWFMAVAFLIGYPRLGANVGGLLTAVATFGVALIGFVGTRVGARHVVGLVALGVLLIAVFAAADILSPGVGGSHLGRSITQARVYGWDWLAYMIFGKLAMHVGILRLPQTVYPILGSIPFFMFYVPRMREEILSAGEDHVLYRVGIPAVVAGMVTAFLFNDSGIVPAMFIMATFILAVQYLRLGEVAQP